jgi:hypothetical protein
LTQPYSHLFMTKFYLSFLFCLVTCNLIAQDSLIHYKVEAQGIYNSNGQVPFWFRSNQFGSIPLSGASTSFIGSAVKAYNPDRSKLFDWGAGIEGRANLGKEAQATLIEAYAKLRVSIFELKAGRTKDVMGIVGDSSLSSGAFSISGNALGIPKISLSIPEFYTIPIFGGLFAFKGNFAHGWVGTLPQGGGIKVDEANTFFHQKSFYGRIGRPEGKFKMYGGFNHQVFWGNYNKTHAGNIPLSTWQEFVKVTLGQVHELSKVGNHLGSLDLAVEYELPSFTVKVYRQALYDIGGLSKLANISDGLNGITFTNAKIKTDNLFNWKRVLFEVFYTKNQGGELFSKVTKSGAENYYNNYQYTEGWSYRGLDLGNPFITNRAYARENLASHPSNYFINNRVLALNLGFEGALNDIMLRTKLSYSQNYGTYQTSGAPFRGIGGKIEPGDPDLKFPKVNQFSFYLEAKKVFKNNLIGGLAVAGDRGSLLYNSIGINASVAKQF